jgi:hypothetical protein
VLVRVSVESAVEATTSARECWKQKLVESWGLVKLHSFET